MENIDINYVLKWSNEADEKFINDFIYVTNTVFSGFFRELIDKKMINNIYGPSLMVVAYHNEKPIGADSMIRNDIEGEVAYETIDTCVLEEYRGMGIFSEITKKEIEILGIDSIIFGFPNNNSFHGYIKMGWHIQYQFYPALFLLSSKFDKEHPFIIDKEYAKWLKKSQKNYYVYKRCNKLYLVMKGKKHYQVIGRIAKEAAQLFDKVKHIGLAKYQSKKKRLYHKDKYHGSVVTYRKDTPQIPFWKHDAFIN